MSAWTSHRPAFGQETSSAPHQVPFRPVQSVPGSLGFGFGPGPSASSGGSSMMSTTASDGGVAFAGARASTSLHAGFGAATGGLMAVATNAQSRRRRRSTTPSDHDVDARAAFEEDSTGSPSRRSLRPIKKIRGSAESGGSPKRIGANGARAGSHDEVDTGKMLTHLSKTDLLAILNSLMSSNPQLVPQVQRLLPAPSLEAFTARLAVLESNVINAIPRGAHGVVMRDEYVWGRVKGPVEEYVSETRTWVTAFCPSGPAETSAQQHPSTIFTFLSTLTASVLRLESVLPRVPLPAFSTATSLPSIAGVPLNPLDPLASSLVPHLLNRWHCLITRVNHEVNVDGRMYGNELIRGWLRTLDGLAVRPQPEGHQQSGICAVAIDGVRTRVVQELGWMGGIKPTAAAAMDVRMGDGDDHI